MRRIMQSQGAEVIHLGHNRSVQEVVDAAIEEDVQGVAVSSYQGGHVEYFEYLVQLLKENGAGHIRVVGGGGGVIVPEEIARLRDSGVTIFSPEDGQRLGLAGMINTVVADCDFDPWETGAPSLEAVLAGDRAAVARAITGAQEGDIDEATLAGIREAAGRRRVPVLGITGTGGSGKSSLTDELIRRLRLDQQDKLRVAVLAVDPTRSRGGGALLGDRIRMSSLDGDRVFFRSLATRGGSQVPTHLDDVLVVVRAAGFDLVILETPGIGQGDAAIVDYADVSLYVMTPEFGASSQLEKIDMLDRADVVAINKFERRGAEDALRDVGRQMVRNREAFGKGPADMPVYGTSAATFNDDGVTALYQELRSLLSDKGMPVEEGVLPPGRHEAVDPHRDHRARRAGALPRRDQRHRPRLPRGHRAVCRRGQSRAAPRVRARRARGRRRGRRRRQRRERGPGRRGPARRGPHRPAQPRSPVRSPPGPRSSSPTPATSRS